MSHRRLILQYCYSCCICYRYYRTQSDQALILQSTNRGFWCTCGLLLLKPRRRASKTMPLMKVSRMECLMLGSPEVFVPILRVCCGAHLNVEDTFVRVCHLSEGGLRQINMLAALCAPCTSVNHSHKNTLFRSIANCIKIWSVICPH